MLHVSFRGRAGLVCLLKLTWAGARVYSASAVPDATPALPGWVIECADCPHAFGNGRRSVQIDGAGVAHVAYGGEALYHAWQSGVDWQIEVVIDGPNVEGYAALVIAGDGSLHIFYMEGQALMYAHGETGRWAVEMVADNIGSWSPPSPAIEPAGRVHVAFYDGNNGELVNAWRDGSGWHFSTVDAEGGRYPSLALDGSGRPHLSYVMDNTGELRYAYEGWGLAGGNGAG